jgi:hypothetical protein
MHASIRVGAWEVPELYRILQESGEVADEEMLRVFNMGIGMVLVVDPAGLRDVAGAAARRRPEVVPDRHRAGRRVGRGLRARAPLRKRRSPALPG